MSAPSLGRGPRPCDECGCFMRKAHRRDKGRSYCGTCYKRIFKPRICAGCGTAIRAHKFDPEPTCLDCLNPARLCLRCGKSVTRAGRLVADRVVCPSCAVHYRDPEPCPSCGRLSRRLSRAPGLAERVCERCQRAATHATCRRCARHRRIICADESGHPLCKACTGERPASHLCPDCGERVPGAGRGRCRGCNAKRRILRRVAEHRERLGQDWTRELFDKFCDWERFDKRRGDGVARTDRHAVFFQKIDRVLCGPDDITQDSLFDIFGADGLRRHVVPLSFLIETGVVVWNAKRLDDLNEERRIKQILASFATWPWARELELYGRSLHSVKPKTRRVYLNAAVRLLLSSGVKSCGDLLQDHLKRYSRKSPGQRSCLAAFISWVEDAHAVRLTLPRRKQVDPVRKEKALVIAVRGPLKRLHSVPDGPFRRSLLAWIISKLYQIPLTRVLALTKAEIADDGYQIVFQPSELAIELEGAVAKHVRELRANAPGDLIFPGRNAAQPLSTAAVNYHVKLKPRRVGR